MVFVHRKILGKSMDDGTIPTFVVNKEWCLTDDCKYLQPPPLPPLPRPPPSSDHSLSPFLITMFCGLAVSFSFICYITISKIYQRQQRNHDNTNETHQDFVNEDLGPDIHPHPIWLINTIGLEQSQIESIHVFKYNKEAEGLIEGTDCSVCLSEFEDDESLRLLPKCSHAFHVACIDTWLRSHKNCPLCRAPIIKDTSDQSDLATIELSLIESSTNEETQGQDVETIARHVVQVENNGEVEKTSSAVRVQSDLVDRHRVQKEEFVAMRRAVSMNEYSISLKFPLHDQERRSSSQLVVSKKLNSMLKSRYKLKGSTSSIHIHSKVMKSTSFGHSSRKASSFKKKCSPINRSY